MSLTPRVRSVTTISEKLEYYQCLQCRKILTSPENTPAPPTLQRSVSAPIFKQVMTRKYVNMCVNCKQVDIDGAVIPSKKKL